MEGLALIQQLIQATDLPTDALNKELRLLIERHGFDVEKITIEQLRLVMADYLQDILLDALEHSKKTASS